MDRHPHLLLLSCSFLALLLVSFAGFASPQFGPVDMGAFYTSLPALNPQAQLGELLTFEKIPTTQSGVSAWKIAYVSSDVNNRKTRVTGIVAAPADTAHAANRPIVAWAHGTTGTAQNCGPSQVLNPAQPLNQYFLMKGNSWTDFGLPAMEAFIKAGYVIVATDYQGLGGGEKHQYTVAATQARDVINSIRAVTQLKEAGAGSQAVIYGWSQGGGATLAAAGLADYLKAPNAVAKPIHIVGFVAMAPFDIAVILPPTIHTEEEAASFLKKLGALFGANIFNFTHYAQNIWGMAAAFPQLSLDDLVTPQGAQDINTLLERKCMHAASDDFNFIYGARYKNLLRTVPKNALAWVEAYRKSSINPVKPLAPVIIYWGTQDVTVPPIMGQLYHQQMCKIGGQVTRVQLPGAQNHFTTPAQAEPLYVPWVADRFAGKPVADGCYFR